MNREKVPCDLITGQEREEVEGAKHKAVTVEMADVTSQYHCAVIDQPIEDQDTDPEHRIGKRAIMKGIGD